MPCHLVSSFSSLLLPLATVLTKALLVNIFAERQLSLTWKYGTKSQKNWRRWHSRTEGFSLFWGPHGWSKTRRRPIRNSACSCTWQGSQYRYLRKGFIIRTRELSALWSKKRNWGDHTKGKIKVKQQQLSWLPEQQTRSICHDFHRFQCSHKNFRKWQKSILRGKTPVMWNIYIFDHFMQVLKAETTGGKGEAQGVWEVTCLIINKRTFTSSCMLIFMSGRL